MVILKICKTALVTLSLLLISSCDGQSNKTPIDYFSSAKLINHVCDTQESVSFVIEDYKLTLPCQAREHFSFSRVERQPVDYANPDYKSGLPLFPCGLYISFAKNLNCIIGRFLDHLERVQVFTFIFK